MRGEVMKKYLALLLAFLLAFSLFACGEETAESSSEVESVSSESETEEDEYTRGIFLGIEGQGTIDRSKALNPDAKIYQFFVSNRNITYKLKTDKYLLPDATADSDGDGKDDYQSVYGAEEGGYELQNILKVGYEYRFKVDDETITEIECITKDQDIVPDVQVKPGEKTVANFLKTALLPVGKTLYVYGGGWDFQDKAAGNNARTIGYNPDWKTFFGSFDEEYVYKDDEKKGGSVYPYGGYNLYGYGGLDCSGYVGWAVYNTNYSESLASTGYVVPSKNMAKTLADSMYGSFVHTNSTEEALQELRPGDIISIKNHVWICAGVCVDGSVVCIHSALLKSVSDNWGGGVHLAALSPNGADDKECVAYKLVDEYMNKHYKDWCKRYPSSCEDLNKYLDFSENENLGIFHWDLLDGNDDSQAGLKDEEKVSEMSANQVLVEVFPR